MRIYKQGARAGQPVNICTYVCPADWTPSDEFVQEVAEKCLNVAQEVEFEKMRRHDFLRPYRDWRRAYRQWMNRAQRRINWEREGNSPLADRAA